MGSIPNNTTNQRVLGSSPSSGAEGGFSTFRPSYKKKSAKTQTYTIRKLTAIVLQLFNHLDNMRVWVRFPLHGFVRLTMYGVMVAC